MWLWKNVWIASFRLITRTLDALCSGGTNMKWYFLQWDCWWGIFWVILGFKLRQNVYSLGRILINYVNIGYKLINLKGWFFWSLVIQGLIIMLQKTWNRCLNLKQIWQKNWKRNLKVPISTKRFQQSTSYIFLFFFYFKKMFDSC